MELKIIAITAVYFLCAVSTSEGILCFQCNSINNSQCTNLEQYGKGRIIVPQPCKVFDDGGSPFCRKTVLRVLDKIKHTEARVIRSCGYIKYKKECYSTDNDDHQEKVCQCFEDSCNSSAKFFSTPMIIAMSSVVAFLVAAATNGIV